MAVAKQIKSMTNYSYSYSFYPYRNISQIKTRLDTYSDNTISCYI